MRCKAVANTRLRLQGESRAMEDLHPKTLTTMEKRQHSPEEKDTSVKRAASSSGMSRRSCKPLRVASLQPSATEILALIGGAHLLVGRSHEVKVLTHSDGSAASKSGVQLYCQPRGCSVGNALYAWSPYAIHRSKNVLIRITPHCTTK